MTFLYSLLRPRVFFDANSGGGGGSGGEGDGQQLEDLFKVLERYPQADKDKVFGARAKQAQSSALSELFKELGVENAESLKAVLKAKKEADDAQKTELQKAQDKASTAEKALADQKTAHEIAIAELEKRIQDSEIKILAGREVKDKDGNVIRPKFRDDALDVVLSTIERKEIVLKDGAYTGIEEALATLAKAKEFLTEKEPEPNTQGTPSGEKPRKPNLPGEKKNAAGKSHARF